MIKKNLIILSLVFTFLISKVCSSENNIYKKIDLFGEVLEKINKEYVDEINQSESMDSAINGLLQSLDPYSAYMSPEVFDEMQTETSGEFGGLGIEVSMESGVVKVISPIDDTPASNAGIKAGDYIVKINDIQVQGKSLSEAVDLVMHAFKNGDNGEIYIQKSPSTKIITLAKSLLEIYNSKSNIKNIGVRHGEKMYETLVTKEEMSKAEDLGNYYKILPDDRNLNYDEYFSKGKEDTPIQEYNSDNTTILDIVEMKKLLLNLPMIKEDLKH